MSVVYGKIKNFKLTGCFNIQRDSNNAIYLKKCIMS